MIPTLSPPRSRRDAESRTFHPTLQALRAASGELCDALASAPVTTRAGHAKPPLHPGTAALLTPRARLIAGILSAKQADQRARAQVLRRLPPLPCAAAAPRGPATPQVPGPAEPRPPSRTWRLLAWLGNHVAAAVVHIAELRPEETVLSASDDLL